MDELSYKMEGLNKLITTQKFICAIRGFAWGIPISVAYNHISYSEIISHYGVSDKGVILCRQIALDKIMLNIDQKYTTNS